MDIKDPIQTKVCGEIDHDRFKIEKDHSLEVNLAEQVLIEIEVNLVEQDLIEIEVSLAE